MIGTYKSESPKKNVKVWNYYTKGYSSYIVGAELTLQIDSVFNLLTCSTISSGKWYYEKDSLYLVYETHRWRSDSLQKHGYEGKWPEIPENPIAIKIKNNKLLWQTGEILEGKKYKTLNVLRKEL